MERKAGRVRPRISAAASGRGFTLIETLVALAILSIISGVLIRVFVNSLRVEDFSRRRDAAVMESEAVLTGSMMGKKPDEVVDELRREGWMVSVGKVGESGGIAFSEWHVAVSNPGAPVVVLQLRTPQAMRP